MNLAREKLPTRNTVFVAGGQPQITYIERSELEIEGHLTRAIALPNQIISLSGPTKCGKTVLCKRVLAAREFVWIEGGQVATTKDIWDKICYELNLPDEVGVTDSQETKGEIGGEFIVSANGSHLRGSKKEKKYKIDSMASAIRSLVDNNMILVIDDFHYLKSETRLDFLRNVKGPVFNGLSVVLLSVTHRRFDAIKSETELVGRFASVTVPEWEMTDLKKIAEKGFTALNINCPGGVIDRITDEAQNSPFLMQKLCWEICFGIGVDVRPAKIVGVSDQYDLASMYVRIAQDSGLPVFQKLEVGPQAKKIRLRRPLAWGNDADIYQAILIALAQTGPKTTISYDELRDTLNQILQSNMPQKHEITSALKNLAKISVNIGKDSGIDWDEDSRKVDISDPYLRFYLRWQIRRPEGPDATEFLVDLSKVKEA
jgi:hypothetical protein